MASGQGATRLLMLTLLVALTTGCRGDQRAAGDAESPSARAEQPTARPVDDAAPRNEGLGRAVGLTFGLPLPAGLDLVERDDDVALFRSPHALDELVEFYDRELAEHARTDGADGTKYEPDDDGTAVFIVNDPTGLRVVYVRETLDLTVLEIERAALAVGRVDLEAETFENRFPWAQGLRIPARHLELVLAAQGHGSRVAGGGLFYVESFEEVDGERIRVLTLRELPANTLLDSAAPDSEQIERPAHWHRLPRRPGGSYDRGGGERSLRPSPELDDEGQPRPFYGTQRLAIDRDGVRH